MKNILKFSIIQLMAISFAVLPHNSEAQVNAGKNIVVSNSIEEKHPRVRIKWYIEESIPENGVHVYRKQNEGSWEKLTDEPFKKGEYEIPEQAFEQDHNLQDYVSIAENIKRKDLKGMTQAMIMIKASQSAHYARYLGIEYHDKKVDTGKTYQYKVTKITGTGEENVGITSPLKVQPHQPGPPPDNIQVKAKDKQVKIKWKPDKMRFLGVNIYRKAEYQEDFEKISEYPVITSKRKGPDGKMSYPDIFFKDDSLENGITYYYQIEALDYFGRPLQRSESISALPTDQTPPPSPEFLKSEVTKLTVSLSWENKYAPDIKGYRVYRSLKPDTNFTQVNKGLLSINAQSFTDKVPAPGNYYYLVAAVDSSGNEGKSHKTMAKVLDIYPPDKPTGLYTVADTGTITLHWQPNTEEDLLGYKVYRTVNKDDEDQYVLLTGEAIPDTTYIDSLPKSAKNKFLYRVVAVDSAFNRSEYSDFSSNNMPDVIPPAKPFIKNVAITENDYPEVQWIPNEDPDLKGYNIYREQKADSLDGKKQLNANTLDPIVEHFTDRWAKPGIEYRYYLEAVDSAGNTSALSNAFPGKIPKKEPEAADNVIKRFRARNRNDDNILRWGVDELEDYLGCIVFRREEGGRYRPLNSLSKETRYKDTNYKPGTTYYYQIRAYHEERGISRSEEKKVNVSPEETEK